MKRTPLIVRFSKRVLVMPNGCWEWTGAFMRKGYPVIGEGGTGGRSRRAHRVAYELFVGPIPTGRVLDHLCRNIRCVNPSHLEPVTQRVNVLRGQSSAAERARRTHCVNGHPLSGDNLRVKPNGQRQCRTCDRDRHRRDYHARKVTA